MYYCSFWKVGVRTLSERGFKFLFKKGYHVITASSSGRAAPLDRRMGQRPHHASISMHEEGALQLICHFDRPPHLSLVNELPMPVARHCSSTRVVFIAKVSTHMEFCSRLRSGKKRSDDVPTMLAMPLPWCSPYWRLKPRRRILPAVGRHTW